MSRVLHLENEEQFRSAVAKDEKVLVDFFATWCRPCQMLGPVLDELSEEVDYTVIKVDVDKFPGLSAEYGVRSIPTLIVTKAGQNLATALGFKSKEDLNALVNNA